MRVRMLLDNSQKPKPQFIELLGRVGRDEDWQRIAQWIASDDPAVKQTAAQAWADSSRPLKGLVRYAGDPVIQPLVIAATRRRGKTPETLKALIEHKPQQEQVVQAWRLAVVAVAGRVSPVDAVLEIDKQLAQQQEPLEWRDQVLSAAIDQVLPHQAINGSASDGPDPALALDDAIQAVWIDLSLARAQVRLANGDPVRALTDYQRFEPLVGAMTASQRNRHGIGSIETMLVGSDVDAVIQWVDQWLANESDAINEDVKAQIAEMFLAAAERDVATEKIDTARQLLAWLRSFVGQSGSLEIQSRIHELEERVDSTGQNENPASAQPSPVEDSPGSTPAQQLPTIPQTKPAPQK